MKRIILGYSSLPLLGNYWRVRGGGELDSELRPKSQKIILEEMG